MNQAKLRWRTVKQPASWEKFIAKHPEYEANFLQSFNWGVFYRRLGQPVWHRLARLRRRPVAGYVAVLETAKFYKFLSIAGGPLLDWRDEALVRGFIADVRTLARQQACAFVRFRPAVADDQSLRQQLASYRLRRSPAPFSVEFAGWLDLSLTDEELRRNMSQSLRRKIRKAQADSAIKISASQLPAEAEEFARLHQIHAGYMGYTAFSSQRLIEQFRVFAAADQAILYSARRQGQILAAIMIFFYGQEASYHFGVSTPLGQKYSSAPLLHLEAILEARRRGLKIYNLWGIAGKDEVKHRYYGLSQFKRSFGLIEHRYLPAHDLVCKPRTLLLNGQLGEPAAPLSSPLGLSLW